MKEVVISCFNPLDSGRCVLINECITNNKDTKRVLIPLIRVVAC